MRERVAFGYVVGVDGPIVTLNLNDDHRGQMASHRDGVSGVTDLASVFGVNAGDRLMVMRVRSVAFAEPREAHRAGIGSSSTVSEPLRNLTATVLGAIRKTEGVSRFIADSLSAPPLGAEAVPLSDEEMTTLLQRESTGAQSISLGTAVRGGGALKVEIQDLLSRHVAVLGSTGQGKSCFTAAVLQQLLTLAQPRLVVFDVNGEYSAALKSHATEAHFKLTKLGDDFKIPYYALGRHGLSRLLLPSDKTQRPALTFALESLDRVITFLGSGAALVGSPRAVLFDDCRQSGADAAAAAISKLRDGSAGRASQWPHMQALSCLVADSQALRPKANTYERSAFDFGHVAPLVTRINRCIEDPQFCEVVDVEGGPPSGGGQLDWRNEARQLVDQFFGASAEQWKVHVVDLRRVAHDLMPIVLGSLLELFAFELFRRGPGGTFPTALILEEAHHYLRQAGDDDAANNGLAYERLAKEGRKFGVSLWLSTQRPAEVSHTVLAQCGTWVAFRLTGEPDLKAIANAGEWADRHEISQIPGLPRQQALVFGSGVVVPTRIIAAEASPVPQSSDPQFDRWLNPVSLETTPSTSLPQEPTVIPEEDEELF